MFEEFEQGFVCLCTSGHDTLGLVGGVGNRENSNESMVLAFRMELGIGFCPGRAFAWNPPAARQSELVSEKKAHWIQVVVVSRARKM